MGSDLKTLLLDPNATPPRRATEGAAGYDLFLLEGGVIEPGFTKKFATGVAFELPGGTVGLVRPRSSAFKRGLLISGTYDEDYRGPCFIQVTNAGPFAARLEAGACYAQLVIVKYETPTVVVVSDLRCTARGNGALGSTGNTGI